MRSPVRARSSGEPAVSSAGRRYLTARVPRSGRVFSLALFAAACGPDESPPAKLTPCELEVSPVRLELLRDETKPVRLSVKSTGGCLLTRAEVDPEVFQLVDLPSLPFELKGGAVRELAVRYSPTKPLPPGPAVRELMIYVGSSVEPEIVTVEGAAQPLGCLAANLRRADFGAVRLGESRAMLVTLENGCEGSSTISGESLFPQGTTFRRTSPTLPATIEPGGSVPLGLAFTAAVPGGAFGRLELELETDRERTLAIELAASVEAGSVLVAPARLEFESVPYRAPTGGASVCGSSLRRIYVSNPGPIPANVSSVRSAPQDFRIAGGARGDGTTVDVARPFSVEPGQHLVISLELRPIASGDHRGSLVITDELGAHSVELVSAHVDDGLVSETFDVSGTPKADLVFLVRGGGDMEALQPRIVGFGKSVLDELDARAIDARVAVVRSDEGTDSELRDCGMMPSIIHNDRDNSLYRSQTLECLLGVGFGGNARSMPIVRSLEVAGTDFDGELLRPDARVFFILVGDLDDESPLPRSAADDLAMLAGRRVAEGVTVFAITGRGSAPCAAGPRLAAATAATGGATFDACAGDWSPFAELLGGRAEEELLGVALRAFAEESTISVAAGGAPVDPSTYSSVEQGRAVVFSNPPFGPFEVRYSPACR
ncbi:MAG: hypothetical protein HYV07_30500 [Deltaproteobacteria bacterium]|nr:hypothetical protein [Deltaproteobacteria bacterium]